MPRRNYRRWSTDIRASRPATELGDTLTPEQREIVRRVIVGELTLDQLDGIKAQ